VLLDDAGLPAMEPYGLIETPNIRASPSPA